MKKIISIISVLAAAASLTACNDINSPAESFSNMSISSESTTSSDDLNSSQSTMSSQNSVISQSSTSSQNTTSSDSYDLKGEDIAAKFEWPYDEPIDLTDAVVKGVVCDESMPGDRYEEITLSNISEYYLWYIQCNYGYLAMMPEDGNAYEFKKYKAGDKIGDLTVCEIQTTFDNIRYVLMEYFAGVWASFEGEITLTGKCRILIQYPDSIANPSEIEFIPDEESCKKLPIVNFFKKPEIQNIAAEKGGIIYGEETEIYLGYIKDYPNINFSKFPDNEKFINVKATIKNYCYRAMFEMPFNGSAKIVELEILD